MPPNNKPLITMRRGERGNVFIFILLGVVLFASLSFVIARGFRGDTASQMSERERTLAASEIISYLDKIERGVNRLRRKGVSVNDIDFAHSGNMTGMANNPNCNDDSCLVFNSAGGGVQYIAPRPDFYEPGTSFIGATGSYCVEGVGNGGDDCHTDGIDNEELIIYTARVQLPVCNAINEAIGLNLDSPPSQAIPQTTISAFAGQFQENGNIISDTGTVLDGRESACIEHSNGFYFYYKVAIAR